MINQTIKKTNVNFMINQNKYITQVSIQDTCLNDEGEFDMAVVSRMIDNRIAVKREIDM
jgi:arginine repressor